MSRCRCQSMHLVCGGFYPPRLNCQRLRPGLYLKVLVFLCCCLDVKQTTIRCLSSSADINGCTPTSRLDRLRLSLDLQVLVPPVPLSSSTAVTTYASPAKTMYAKSLSAGPLRLRAWIWLSRCEVGMVNLSPPDRVRFRA